MMDELSADQLRELEEQLYSQVHHQDSTQPTFSVENSETQKEVEPKRFLTNRYWTQANYESIKSPTKLTVVEKQGKKGSNMISSESVEIVPQNVKKGKPKGRKVPNPFATPQKQKQQQNRNNKNAQQQGKANQSGPFARQAQRLQKVFQYENRKQKSRNARASMMTKHSIPVETVVIDSSDEDANSDQDVIIVPLPPVPIYNLDESEEENEVKKSDNEEHENLPNKVKNDAFITPISKKSSPSTTDIVSRSNSPNSVMSQDDFIGQNDRQRLLKTATIVDSGELNILSNSNDSLLEPPTPPSSRKNVEDPSNEIECIGTFIKPTATTKQSYRVDQSGFRAIDVYESESDIVSDGVYSKGMGKSQPQTTIRNIDRSSGSEEEASTPIQSKTKRLRKRRVSGSNKGSESNGGGADTSETDEDDGVAATGIPFISRGPAVESCKSKRFRLRTASHSSKSGNMSDSEFIATLSSLAQGNKNNVNGEKNEAEVEKDDDDDDDDDSEIENLPSARDIAETVINHEQAITSTPVRRIEKVKEERKDNSAKQDSKPEAVPEEIAADIEKLFDKINEIAAKKVFEISDDEENYEESIVSHIDPASDVSAAIADKTIPNEKIENAGGDRAINYFIAYLPAKMRSSDGFGWDEEMRHFYNSSWGGENVREEDLLRTMNRDRRLWVISDADKIMGKGKRDRREKCINCCCFGHTRGRCPKPRKPLVCYMCGENGHQESRCPNTQCLRCGSKTNFFCQSCKKCIYWNNRVCPLCKLRGHSLNDCPDKWRRYHSTTKRNASPNSKVVYNKRRYCCFCGRKGHISDDCKKSYFRSDYPMISSEIKSFEKSYGDSIMMPNQWGGLPCRLLFDPKKVYDFGLAAKTTHKQVYGRFLCAVGLGHLIGKEKDISNGNPFQPSKSNIAVQTVQHGQPNSSAIISPDQVPEISESTNNGAVEAVESLQMPPPRVTIPSQSIRNTSTELMDHDSDSNYSFSDHFEPPTSYMQSIKSEPLPDFISLTDNTKLSKKYSETPDDDNKNNSTNVGISAKYVVTYSDEEENALHPDADDAANLISPPDLPCAAKIYVSDEHSKYFQSHLGEEYLSKVMLENNLIGRLGKTIVGYAIFIHGLPSNQEKLQRELEIKFKNLNNARAQQCEESARVPKYVNALIRLLQLNINHLYQKLGNASDLCKRLLNLDKHSSKSGSKASERIRKTLNMIFLGQAGLFHGDKHVDTLLKGLQKLLNNLKGEERVPEDLRKEIDKSFRMIFTSHHHQNYSELLAAYLKLSVESRNRMPALEIEPSLLGNAIFNIKTGDVQKIRSNNNLELAQNQRAAVVPLNANNAIEEGILLLNVVIKDEKNQKNFDNNQSISSHEGEGKPPHDSTSAETIKNKVQQKSKSTSAADRYNNKRSHELLNQIATSPKAEEKGRGPVVKDSKAASLFWSRESQSYIQEMIKTSSDKPANLERLQRISKKAAAGGLSYNDYRSVIELYNVTVKINKK